MLTIIRIFFEARGPNPALVLTCLLLSSIAGGIGIATLLPLLSLLSAGDDEKFGSVARYIKDALAYFGVQPDLTSLLLLIFGCIVIKGALTFVAMRHVGYAAARVTTDMRTRLIEQVLHVRWKFLTSQPTGRLLHAIGGEAGLAGNSYALAAGFLANLLQAIVSIVLSIIISWKLACVAIVFGVMIAGTLHFLVRMAKRAGTRQNDRLRELVVYLLDALNNIKPIKAMARQTEFFGHLAGKLAKIRGALQKQTVSQEARRSLEEIMLTASLCSAFYVSVAILEYDVSKLIVMGLLLMQTMRNVGKIQESLQKAVILQAPYHAVQQLTRELGDAREEAGGVEPPDAIICRMEGVSFGYGDALVLDHVDFEIVRGRITALTGPSGAGKSTITDLLLCFYRPQAGRLLVDGVPLDRVDLHAWRKLIGYVPQDLMLLHDTIHANLVLGDADVSADDVREALQVAGAWQFVSERPNGLETIVGEKGLHLSGGQRQRIALARALIRRPRILILDEVSSALDPETEQDICQRLRALSRQMAILVITHRPAFLDIAHRIYELDSGSLVARDTALSV